MTTKFEKLDARNFRSLHDISMAMYLDGMCYEFALALHYGLGWPLIGLMEGSVIRHALVQSDKNILWDVRGQVRGRNIGKPFGLPTPFRLKAITEIDLQKTRPISPNAINRASLCAQALWPHLPWSKKTLRKRSTDFMTDLEKLCRKHGIWIRAHWPAAQIVLSDSCGDEKGFTMTPTLDGQYFIDRRL